MPLPLSGSGMLWGRGEPGKWLPREDAENAEKEKFAFFAPLRGTKKKRKDERLPRENTGNAEGDFSYF